MFSPAPVPGSGGGRVPSTLVAMQSLAMIENWPVPTAAAPWYADGTVSGSYGPTSHRFPLASVTKPLAAYAVLVAYEEGAVELDEPPGPRARPSAISSRTPADWPTTSTA